MARSSKSTIFTRATGNEISRTSTCSIDPGDFLVSSAPDVGLASPRAALGLNCIGRARDHRRSTLRSQVSGAPHDVSHSQGPRHRMVAHQATAFINDDRGRTFNSDESARGRSGHTQTKSSAMWAGAGCRLSRFSSRNRVVVRRFQRHMRVAMRARLWCATPFKLFCRRLAFSNIVRMQEPAARRMMTPPRIKAHATNARASIGPT